MDLWMILCSSRFFNLNIDLYPHPRLVLIIYKGYLSNEKIYAAY